MDVKDRRIMLLDEILRERERQDAIHGGIRNDDLNTPKDWILFGHKWMSKAFEATHNQNGRDYRKRMVQAAALMLAAIETFDRHCK